jgi:hypothetical protein
LKWLELPEIGQTVFDFNSEQVRSEWALKSGDLASVFTNSRRTDFGSKTEYFIGSAEVGTGRFDDTRRGVIESPSFVLDEESYILFVSGGEDREKLYVAIVELETNREWARVTGTGDNIFHKVNVTCPGAKGKKAVIRVVDQATESWGHINFGGLFSDPLAPYRN